MSRDLDLIRRLLLDLLQQDAEVESWCPSDSVADPATVREHVRLMIDVGLIQATVETLSTGEWHVRIPRLTNHGQDFVVGVGRMADWRAAKHWIAMQRLPETVQAVMTWIGARLAKAANT